MEDASPRPKRPRRHCSSQHKRDLLSDAATTRLRRLLRQGRKIIVFSGAGMSVAAGLKTFTGNNGGWYQQAARQVQLLATKQGSSSSKQLFGFHFLEQHPAAYWHFFCDTLYRHMTNKACQPTLSHVALRTMEETGQLVRHYTLNIDGLHHAKCSAARKQDPLVDKKADELDTNHIPPSTLGKTVELHGNIHELVCRTCGNIYKMTKQLAKDAKTSSRGGLPPCPDGACEGELRFRVLMYDDEEGHIISQGLDPFTELLPNDLDECQAILWIGISFAQQASCRHFQTVYNLQQSKKGLDGAKYHVPIFIVNPRVSEALENLMDGLQMELGSASDGVYTVESTSDAILKEFCGEIHGNPLVS